MRGARLELFVPGADSAFPRSVALINPFRKISLRLSLPTNTMAEFSWSDSLKAAFAPCLSCLNFASRTPHNDRPSSRSSSRPDLDRLLRDVDTDTEAETLSLHSNIGDSRRKRKKKRGPPKSITLFGFNLFGKPPIRLEGDDDLAAATISPAGGHGSGPMKKSISTSTLDSDAAPLDSSTIAQLSTAQLPSPGPSEEELRRKEERRRRRRERKEKKEAIARAIGQADPEFEGFPGSGPGVPTPSPPREFVLVSPMSQTDELAEDADFDAMAYNTRRHTGSARSESDSRSRTSASMSNPDSSYYNHHYSQQPAPIPAPSTQRPNPLDVPQKKKKSPRSKGSSKSSSSKTSQSASIRSPVEATFPSHPIVVRPDFEGFQNDGAFPSTGFGGGRMSRKNSEMGVLLARRGGD